LNRSRRFLPIEESVADEAKALKDLGLIKKW
jgi:hypothetical protein